MDAIDIIDKLGGPAALARALSLSDTRDRGAKTVRAWKLRNSIPAAMFEAVASVATKAGEPEITLEVLAKAAARRGLRLPEGASAP